MPNVTPKFWGRFRGVVDPQRPFSTTYNYTASFYYNGQSPTAPTFGSINFSILGPPQLSKRNFMEIRWEYLPGMTQVIIVRNGISYYQSNAAEQGFRDEDQYNVINGGVTNQ